MEVTILDDVDGGIIEDASINKGASSTNYGGRNYLWIEGSTTPIRNVLIKVGLSDYSDITEVITAHFGFYPYSWYQNHTIDWYEILIDWVEGTSIGAVQDGSCCWSHAKYSQVLWNTPGCRGAGTDRNAVADGSKQITATGPDWLMPISPTLAFKWATDANYGVVMETLDCPLRTLIYSSERTPSVSPYFYMEYVEGVAISLSRGRLINMEGTLGGLTKSTLNNLGGI